MNKSDTVPDIHLQVTKVIRASRERVFAAWTRPELMKQWFAPGTRTVRHAASDLRVGGAYTVGMSGGECGGKSEDEPTATGTYLQIIPNELLVFTWKWQDDAPETRVTVRLEDVSGGTRVTLLHERFPAEDVRDRHQQGWAGCLENLASFAQRAA